MLHISQKQAFANRRIHRSPGDVCFDLINVLLLTVFTLICVFPFYYLFINTISDNALSARGMITLFPKGVHFENYIQIFKISGILTLSLIHISEPTRRGI